MNENLRRIALEAGYAAPELAGRMQKLVSLLLEESKTVMKQHDYHGEWLGEKIKEHFGVK